MPHCSFNNYLNKYKCIKYHHQCTLEILIQQIHPRTFTSVELLRDTRRHLEIIQAFNKNK